MVATINVVMRTLADPRRRAVFERIVTSDEITVAELTRGSGVTQGAISQHLKSLKLAGLVAERPEGRNVYYRAEPKGLTTAHGWTLSSRGPSPGSRTERVFALSTPASCCRRTIRLSRT
jgi:DNA-binding transcriptional ArsR family regulator